MTPSSIIFEKIGHFGLASTIIFDSLQGVTYSSDFPTTTNAIQPSKGDTWSLFGDAFVTQIISVSGVYTYGYSTYLGGDHVDYSYDIAVDSDGNATVVGGTYSSDFPTHNAIQAGHSGGDYDAFIAQIIGAGEVYTYAYSTYLGGSDTDYAFGVAMDSMGNTYVTGDTRSPDFPTTTNAIQTTYGGGGDQYEGGDVFVTHIISTSGVYTYGYSTYLGGDGKDSSGEGIAIDTAGSAYVTGFTLSSNFPTTANAMQINRKGGIDAFVTRIVLTPHRVQLPLILKQ